MKTLNKLIPEVLRQAWCAHTSVDKVTSTTNPSKGQCVPTALLVQDLCGGIIVNKRILALNESHYFNIINGKIRDYTQEQYATIDESCIHAPPFRETTRDYLLKSSANTQARYLLLCERYFRLLRDYTRNST